MLLYTDLDNWILTIRRSLSIPDATPDLAVIATYGRNLIQTLPLLNPDEGALRVFNQAPPMNEAAPADQPVNGPAADQPVNGPAADQPVNGPAADQPVNGPVAQQPVNGPAAEQPVNGPVAQQPVNGPVDQQPVNPPAIEQPVNEPVAQQPVNGPAAEQPANPPAVEQPVNGPVDQQPVNPPAIEQPVNGPVAQQPVNPPAVEQPVNGPVAQQLVNGPVAQQPVNGPVAQQPVNGPVDQQPVNPPAVEQPVNGPVAQQPVNPPAVEQPVNGPVAQQPGNPPAVGQPVNGPAAVEQLGNDPAAAGQPGGIPLANAGHADVPQQAGPHQLVANQAAGQDAGGNGHAGNNEDDRAETRVGATIPQDAFSTTNRGVKSVWLGDRQWRLVKTLQQGKERYRCCGCSASLTLKTTDNICMIFRITSPHPDNCSTPPDPARREQTLLRRRVQHQAAEAPVNADVVREIIADHGNVYTNTRDQRNLTTAAYRATNSHSSANALRDFDTDRAGYYEDFVSRVEQLAGTCRGSDDRFLLYRNRTRPMLIFAADRNIVALNQASGMIWDATFTVAPRGWSQLWTGVAEIDGHYIPVYYVLMASKSQEDYEFALLQIRTDLAQRQLFHLVSSFYYITDYEVAMRNALQDVWEIEPDKIQGCYWHLCRSWVRKISETMAQEYRAPERIRSDKSKWLHRLCGLPCLTLDECTRAWQHLQNTAPQSPDVTELIGYLNATYMGPDSTFPPGQWCRAPLADAPQRTSNPAEGFHNFINRPFRRRHPNVDDFCERLCLSQSQSETRLNSVEAGIPAHSRSLEPRRAGHYQAYHRGALSIDLYLERIAQLSGVSARDV
ncbi:hypothetical protein FOZ60_011541 [Perkinsus olseni]|uniref:MULE transposase domain-containing protein n=1 Tax=Perkinsus olseni TaxID=32597 RepID=A0A7J6ND24_PEROL|nr:hypothetical protein FOZ60_011541 [Perkinsus olseni]